MCKIIKKLLYLYIKYLYYKSKQIHSLNELKKFFKNKIYPFEELSDKINCKKEK